MHPQTLAAFYDEFEKIALPRYEKAIAAGVIPRAAVAPAVPGAARSLPTAKRLTREHLVAPAPVAPDALTGKRALNARLFQAQAKAPMAATGIPTAGVDIDPEAGAHTSPNSWGEHPSISTGVDTGQKLRGSIDPFSSYPKPLLAPHPVDATLNKAVLQHELGEAAEMNKPVRRPFASHLGPEPILRENLGMQGDPGAHSVMQRVREQHPEDQLIQRGIRQAGGTPNAPIPLGGRQHRAVESYIDRNAAQFNPRARAYALEEASKQGKRVGYASPQEHQQAAAQLQKTPEQRREEEYQRLMEEAMRTATFFPD